MSAARPASPSRGLTRRYGRTMLAALALVLLTASVFWPVSRHGFIQWDDGPYVFDNQVVRKGLTAEGLRWAFTTETAANWHPLTWISHMTDVQLFGLDPGLHHRTNVILHLCGTLLLFLFLFSSTSSYWRSAAVAALFAIHPLHVESVAWVAERKDVLSGLFWMLNLLAYLAYARRRTSARYLLVVLVYALGLLTKPMLVTLPLIMLLLDFWPLGRFQAAGDRRASARLFREKAPLLLLSAASSIVTFLVQARAGAVSSLDVIPFGQRLANAATAYVQYLWQTALPTDLVFLYPYPLQTGSAELPLKAVLLASGAGLLLAWWTFLAARARMRQPALFVGWLWYLLSLLPVIGIIQVGLQTMADHYTYLPLIGIFLVVAWACPALNPGTGPRGVLPGLALVVITGLALLANNQTGYWKDDLSLFGHAVRVAPGNWIAQNNLGNALALDGQLAKAVPHFEEAIRVNPTYSKAWYNLGLIRYREGRLDDAEALFGRTIALKPDYAEAYDNLGAVLLRQGRNREALAKLEDARRLNPGNPVTLNNLGAVWLNLGDLSLAEGYYREALRHRADYAAARNGLEAIRRRRRSSR